MWNRVDCRRKFVQILSTHLGTFICDAQVNEIHPKQIYHVYQMDWSTENEKPGADKMIYEEND